MFKHDFSICAACTQFRGSRAIARVRFVPSIRQRMDAEAEPGAEFAAGVCAERDVAECRNEQNDAARIGRNLADAGPALADRRRADLT